MKNIKEAVVTEKAAADCKWCIKMSLAVLYLKFHTASFERADGWNMFEPEISPSDWLKQGIHWFGPC